MYAWTESRPSRCDVCCGPRIKQADAWMISVCCPECDYDVCYECLDIES